MTATPDILFFKKSFKTAMCFVFICTCTCMSCFQGAQAYNLGFLIGVSYSKLALQPWNSPCIHTVHIQDINLDYSAPLEASGAATNWYAWQGYISCKWVLLVSPQHGMMVPLTILFAQVVAPRESKQAWSATFRQRHGQALCRV